MRRRILTGCALAMLAGACFTPRPNMRVEDLDPEEAYGPRAVVLEEPAAPAEDAADLTEAVDVTFDVVPPIEPEAEATDAAPHAPHGPRASDTPDAPAEEDDPALDAARILADRPPMQPVAATLQPVRPILTPRPQPPPDVAPDPLAELSPELAHARALFVHNCARCHGEDGSGTGPTVLDRPARNFRDGGFSFGNTEEALFRTVSTGIPGSPMPAFGALPEDDRRALARYVQHLGPPIAPVADADTHMLVGDEAVMVRGILPPRVDGDTLVPRGLIIGTPDGFSFEYRTDDVTLLAVRQGAFVRRSDWTGRGGSPLEPLGRLLWTDSAGSSGSTLAGRFAAGDEALTARLVTSAVQGPDFSLSYELVHPTRGVVANVVERVAPVTHAVGAGFRRTLEVTAELGGLDLVLRRHPAGAPLRHRGGPLPTGGIAWFLMGMTPERAELWGVRRPGDVVPDGNTRGVYRLALDGRVGATQHLELFTLLAPQWTPLKEKDLHAARPEEL